MKQILIQLCIMLFTFTNAKTIVPLVNNNHDKNYFKTFKRNKQPENKKFILINKSKSKDAAFFYVIYKENALGQGFYFKVVFDTREKPIATYYATENNKDLNNSTLENLKKILGEPVKQDNTLEPTPAQCVINCHRKNNCYSKETSLGVILCSLDCQASCA